MMSYPICTVILVIVGASCGNGKFFRNDYKYFGDAGGWLKMHKLPATWSEARLMCKYEGAVLASPLNKKLQAAMDVLSSDYSSVFTGIHSTFGKGIFASIEGVSLEEIPVPFQGSRDDVGCSCYDKSNLQLADCERAQHFMCYKKDDGSMNLTICGPNSYGYKYEERTGSCYKVHTTGRTWRRGYQTCMAEQGYPVIINSPTEAQVIKELFATYPDGAILANFTHVASIGALDWGERGSWWTVHGDTLEEAGYAVWEGGKPDSSTQYCVGVNRSGKLNDIWCNLHTFAVICERPPGLHSEQLPLTIPRL